MRQGFSAKGGPGSRGTRFFATHRARPSCWLRAGLVPALTVLLLAPSAIAAEPTQSFPLEPVIEDKAPLWAEMDADLQQRLEATLARMELDDDAADKRLGLALIDLTHPEDPVAAAINPDEMMYAASLPKIAVLLAAFEKIERDEIPYDDEMRESLTAMIRYSSNREATALMDLVGKEYIAEVLLSPKYRLYDPARGGGLWAGKNYGAGGVWQRDPLKNLSHAATPMQIARFYYMLSQGDLVSPGASRAMREILSEPGIPHKFVRGMNSLPGEVTMARKSGTWGAWHADSALVEYRGRTFIAVGLCEDPEGDRWLEQLIVEMALLVRETAVPGEEIHWVDRSRGSTLAARGR